MLSYLPYDLCVIGSGPAGIIVALEYTLLNPTHKVVIIEFGDKNLSNKNILDESIKINNFRNHHDPYECTNKGFGGTSATWGGRCVMYDEIDFIPRPIIGDGCTWNIELYKEIKNHLSKAAEYFECGKPDFDLKSLEGFQHSGIAEGFKEGVVTDSILERWSMPTRFGKRYDQDVKNRKNIVLLEGFEARSFSEPDADGEISTLFIRKVDSKELTEVKARNFVVAAGAQESTRLLLKNKRIFKNLSFPPKALGRYYQGHVSGKIASVKFFGNPRKTDFSFLKDREGVYLRRRFQFSNDFLLKNNLLNTAIWLDNPLYYNPKHGSGAMSFMYLSMITPIIGKKLAPPAIAHSITKGKREKIFKHLLNIVKDFPSSLTIPISIFYRRYCIRRKLPGVFLYSPNNSYALHFHAEQVPNESNKMELDKDGETLLINYSYTDEDIQSVIKLHDVLDRFLQDNSCGKLEYWYPKNKLAEEIEAMSKDGIHQCGTTRISETPEQGVVDFDLKVWGTKNLFVCSSSVFPTSGQANPTFLLGAFAIRLTKHLTNIYAKS